MAKNKTVYYPYPPVEDPTKEILAALSPKQARADEVPVQAQMDASAPVQPQYQAQITPPMPSRQIPMDHQDPMVRELRNKLMRQFESGAAAQKANLGEVDQMYQMAEQDAGFIQNDISPSLGYLSRLTGLEVGKGYKPPVEGSEKRKQLLGYLQAKVDSQNKLNDDEISVLKTLLAQRQGDLQQGRDSRFQQAEDTRAFLNVKKSFDKPIADLNDFNQSLGVVRSAVATGDVFAVQNALSNFARLGGEKGVLTDQDIVRVVPDNLKSRTAKAMAFLKSDPGYQMPPEVAQAIAASLDRLEAQAINKFQDNIEAQRENFLMGPGAYPSYAERVYSQTKKHFQPKQAVASPAAGQQVNLQNAAAEELKRRRMPK
jgi:hypothetical protein